MAKCDDKYGKLIDEKVKASKMHWRAILIAIRRNGSFLIMAKEIYAHRRPTACPILH